MRLQSSRAAPVSGRADHRRAATIQAVLAKQTSQATSGKVLDEPGTQSLLDWSKRVARVSLDGVAPAVFGMGRGIMATTDAREGQVLVKVPRGSAISLTPRQRNPMPELLLSEYWDKQPWFVKIGLMLLHEKSKGDASPFAPYIRELPSRMEVPVLWEDSVLQALQYPYLIHQVKEQRLEWEKLHAKLLDEGQAPGAGSSGGAPALRPSREEFFWALAAVRSRTFSGPYVGSTLRQRVQLAVLVAGLVLTNATFGLTDPETTLGAAVAAFIFNILYEVMLSRSAKQYALCPIIDLFNHSSASKSEVEYDYFADSYAVASSQAYARGDQVMINYGQNNDGLMQFYGFSEVSNPGDVYVMTNLLRHLHDSQQLGTAGGSSGEQQRRLAELDKEGLLASGLQMVRVQRDGFPLDTLQALRYLLAADWEAAKGPQAFSGAGSPDVEVRLAQTLVFACRAELRSMGTTLEEDSALLASQRAKSMPYPERAALAFRVEKKRVLSACLTALGA